MTATITPVLHYSDLTKASEFLQAAFGFDERVAHKGPDGEPVYVELTLDGCTIGIGRSAEAGSPFDLGPCAVYAAIDDPDTLHAASSRVGRGGRDGAHRPGVRLA